MIVTKASDKTYVPQNRKRIHSLDTLRGLAIILVMIGHFLPETFSGLQGTFISSFAGAGVLLFFYLSGFLIYRSVQTQSPAVFLLRRLFKLFPAYWMNVIVISLMAMVAGIGVIPDAKTFFSNILMIQEWTHSPLLNNVYWTLQIEVKFYIVMVIFCYYFDVRWIYALLAVLLATNMAVFPFLDRGSTLITYLITFFPGIAAARLMEKGWTRTALTEVAVVTAIAALNLLVFQSGTGGVKCFYALILSVALVVGLAKPLKVPLFSFFAKISYSHYLYHTVIGYALIAVINQSGSLTASLVALVTASVVSIAVSTAAFYWVENPGVAFGRKLESLLPNSLTKTVLPSQASS